MKLARLHRFTVPIGVVSQFQIGSYRCKGIENTDGEALKYQYTNMSGYITIMKDVEEIVISFCD